MDEKGLLSIRVTDESGSLSPCRLHIKQPDGSCWIPQDVRDPTYTESDAPDLLLPGHYSRYLHLCHGANLQSVHLTHGSAQIPVPAGRLQVFVARGHEFLPISDRVEIGAGQPLHKDYVLRRRTDMPAQGWFGGDMHTHFCRWQPSDDHVWARLLQAEDLHAVNNMVYKHAGVVEAPQYAYGQEGEHLVRHHHEGHHVIASGEEFRDNDLYGHMIAAGITEVIEPISVGQQLGGRENYPVFAAVCDWTHEQGGIAGWAHGGTLIKLFESLPIEAALGKLDFVENIQFNMFYGFMFWYRLLNCGIRLACTGGSDFPFSADLLAPWYPNLGLDRTYVHVDGEFTYKNWIEGIRHGHTFATNGPLLFLTVNGQPPGTEVQLEDSQDWVMIEAQAICNYGLDCLEIVKNGAVVKHVEGKGGQTGIT
ncbi:MAG: CehA/McbA family metallohydrolase, partial [Candidatus Latescibacteria bacterium]|nr:CehA/McbA family metallohydrolase [Candidatus Latescibacterota bacterium]